MAKRGFGKRGASDLLYPVVIFIVVNLLFFSMLLIFVYRQQSGALIYEQAYAKQIAMMIDYAKPEMGVPINFSKGIEIAKKNGKTSGLVEIDDKNREVIVKLDERGGYAFKYFSDYDVKIEFADNFLLIYIKEKGEENAKS